MKNFAPAVLLLPCACAFSQSSVTLYGVVDLGINYVSNAQTSRTSSGLRGAQQVSLADGGAGGYSGGRWGLSGSEDLGGGMKAIFRLENGFSANNGAFSQGGALFGRQAWMGLSTNYGRVTLGRQYDPVVDFYGTLLAGPQSGGLIVSHPGDLDNGSNSRRINNSIKYTSPTMRGVTVSGLYSLGGVAGSFATNRIWSLGAGYAMGPVKLGAAFMDIRNPNTSFFGNNPNGGPATSNNLGSVGSTTSAESSPVYAGYASAKTLQIAAVSGTYTFGAATVGAAFSNSRFQNLGSTSGPNPFGYRGTAVFNDVELSGRYQVTPSLQIGSALNYMKNNGTNGSDGAKYEMASVSVDYYLSKSTDVYLLAAYEHASGTDSLHQAAVAGLTGVTASATSKQAVARLALRHKF